MKIGSFLQIETGRVHIENAGAQNVGRHQVGRELDARELGLHHVGQRLGHERLGGARHAFEQNMPAAEEGNHQQFKRIFQPHQHFAGFGA